MKRTHGKIAIVVYFFFQYHERQHLFTNIHTKYSPAQLFFLVIATF